MTWLRRLVSRDLLEQQLDAELQDHFDRLVADLVGRGHPPHEAARLARLELAGSIYLPFMQVRGRPMTILVAPSGPVANVSAAIVAAVQPRVPSAPMRVRTFASQIESSLFEPRLVRLLTTIFGGLALLLAAIGLYGLLSYNVALRIREMGVRLALGARPVRLIAMVMRDALRMVGLGIGLGLPLAWLLSRLIGRFTFGLEPTDPITIVFAVATLITVGIAAAAIPARRAARVDPMTSLRLE